MKTIKNSLNVFFVATIFSIAFITFNACSNDDDSLTADEEEEVIEEEVVIDDTDFEATDWTTETHSKDADPNFDEVFEDNAVKRIDIVITEARWQSMLDDMTDLYGTFGRSGGRRWRWRRIN